ncbi:MAG: hypothetical protein AAFX56_13565 [Pseudomonadota bacterium]
MPGLFLPSTKRCRVYFCRRLKTIKTGPGGSSSIQNLRYNWDTIGNLTQRNNDRQSLTESFGYDDLNRLGTVDLGLINTLSRTYSPGGNERKRMLAVDYNKGCQVLFFIDLSRGWPRV